MLKKALKISLFISFLFLAMLVGALFLTKQMKKEIQKAEREVPDQVEFTSPKVISEKKMAERIQKKLKKKGKIYSMDYQKAAQSIINQLKKDKKYSLEEPLLIVNPFGTNKTSLYIYFKHGFRVNTSYTVSVKIEDGEKEKKLPDFSETMYTNTSNLPLAEQEGQIIGLMAGAKNYVSVYIYDESGTMVGKAGYKISLPEDGEKIPKQLRAEHNRELSQLSKGLFAVFGLSAEEKQRSLPFYDNEGILRAGLTLDSGASDVNLKSIDGKLFYAIDERRYALVTPIGKVEKIFDLGKPYRSYGDFDFTPANRYMLTFTKKNGGGNYLSLIDLYDGKSSEVLNFATLFPNQENLELTSLRIINDQDVLISESSTSSIIRLNNFLRRPEVKLFLSSYEGFAGKNSKEVKYQKQGEFSPHSLQSCVYFDRSQTLEKRMYQIQVLNHRGGRSKSEVLNYEIDEAERTYSLRSAISLPLAAKTGGITRNGENTIVSLGGAGGFYEYNPEENLLSAYKVEADFRKALKFDMKGTWFTK